MKDHLEELFIGELESACCCVTMLSKVGGHAPLPARLRGFES